MDKRLIDAINAEYILYPGQPIWLADLRKRVPSISKQAFDDAVLNLAKSEKYFLTRHFHPAQTSEQEKADFIPDGSGNYYIAINPRNDVVFPSVNEREIPKQSDVETIAPKDEPIEARIQKTLKPSRRGRPVVPEHLRRKQIRPGFRLSGWVADWLMEKGDVGHTIEAALIGFYGIKPPE